MDCQCNLGTSLFPLTGGECQFVTASRDLHHSIAQEEEADPRSRILAGEEHWDRSHMVELGHTHTQVVGVDRHLAEDTVRLVEPGSLAATEAVAVARTLTPVGDSGGKLAVGTDLAVGIVVLAGDGKRILGEVKAVVMDVAMGD